MRLIKETNPKARKNHNCDGWQQIEGNYDQHDPKHEEAHAQIIKCNHIKTGDIYVNQFIREYY